MRHFACSHRVAGRGVMVVAITCFALGGFALAGAVLAGPASAAPSTTTVDILLAQCGQGVYFCFAPSDATVSVGDTVNWTDQSGFTHLVTRCDPQDCDGNDAGTGSDSLVNGAVGPGQDFSHTFGGAGTYNYYCSIHGYALMHGSVTVTAPQITSTTSTSPSTTTPATPTTTLTSTPSTVGVGGHTTAAPASTATATGVEAEKVDATAQPAQLAATGFKLPLVPIGLSLVGFGGVLLSAEHRTRRSNQR